MFATSIGDFFFDGVLVEACFLFFVVKILITIHEDGETKKTAKESLAAWITRWLK